MNAEEASSLYAELGPGISTLKLFSSVGFVYWLVTRQYRDHEVSAELLQALEEARAQYFRMCAVFGLIAIAAFAFALFRDV